MVFSHATTNHSGNETVKLHFCFFSLSLCASQLSAITERSLVPRNEVEGVIAQSDGADISHPPMHKKIILFLFSYKKKNLDKTFLFVLQPSSLNLSLCLSISTHPTPQHILRSYVHYGRFAEHTECL